MKEVDYLELYSKLQYDEDFQEKFEPFMKDLMDEIKKRETKTIHVDKVFAEFIYDYIESKRNNKIDDILRKKDS